MQFLRFAFIAPLALAGTLALAHTELAGSVPADHSMLDAAPEEVMLHFSEPVRLTALTIQKEGEAERSLGPVATESAEHFTVAAPELAEGHYTVSWRALSADTHVMTGEFMFMVGGMDDHSQHMDHGEAVHTSGEEQTVHGEHSGAH